MPDYLISMPVRTRRLLLRASLACNALIVVLSAFFLVFTLQGRAWFGTWLAAGTIVVFTFGAVWMLWALRRLRSADPESE